MKDWNYYRETGLETLSHKQLTEYREQLVEAINNTPLTMREREKRLQAVPEQVRSYAKDFNKAHLEKQAQLDAEFWADVREELGYTTFLTRDGVAALEYAAYERGHSAGYSEIYSELCDLTDLARKLVAK